MFDGYTKRLGEGMGGRQRKGGMERERQRKRRTALLSYITWLYRGE